MKKMLTYIVLIIGIVVVGTMIFNRIKNNETQKKTSEFNELIMNAAEVYVQKNETNYPNFKDLGDRLEVNAQQLLDAKILKSDIENPTKKQLKDIIIRLTIETDKTIKYEVLD